MQLTLHTGDDEDDNSCEKSSLKSLCLKLMGMGIFHIIMLDLNITESYINVGCVELTKNYVYIYHKYDYVILKISIL